MLERVQKNAIFYLLYMLSLFVEARCSEYLPLLRPEESSSLVGHKYHLIIVWIGCFLKECIGIYNNNCLVINFKNYTIL